MKISKKNFNEESDKGYFPKVDVQYIEKVPELHDNLLFLLERMKIENFQKLAANLHDKTEYFAHIRNLKQALNHRLVLKKVHRMIQFNQNAWLKSYIHINTDLKKMQKMILKKISLSWWIIVFLEKLWKMWENIEILNLSQQNKEKTTWFQNQIIILQSLLHNIY